MPGLNLSHAEDAWITGSSMFEEWLENFEKQWYEPLTKTMLAMWLHSLPPGVLVEMRKRHPEALAAVEAMVSGKGRL